MSEETSDREKEIFATAITLFSYWNARPHIRLGQLLYNVSAEILETRDAKDIGDFIFNVRDKRLMDAMTDPDPPAKALDQASNSTEQSGQ
jgi:hypothetical protein